ncbi:MAG TPA: tRNA (adenosine(37)-N6)-threonylcarbamoyltransferase complex transferase subunit TsaD [Firmicutes bacterium]|jgi:N6-L-threonylcarbamoyladenine synthase|nr:tRNA (adenosine(37)-N6)-threonylcarbamoyltransferase complex transferase subunit TsaD [Bacillota bacterium]
MSRFLTLGIESSCDDTSVAVIEDGYKIRSNIISSQIDLHQKFGGVVPELAARSHLEAIGPIYQLALKEAGVTIDDIQLIAATYGPGLVGSLLIGLSFAKGLALSTQIPFIGVNHIEGHIYANVLGHPEIKPPLICLTVSGGHTDLLWMGKWGSYQILGQTTDDAAGEAFDKIARVLGLGYPGGPYIDKIAKGAQDDLEFVKKGNLTNTYNFSFSGLKTAVINYIQHQKQLGLELNVPRIAASFQRNVVIQLTAKLFHAIEKYDVNTVLLSGGVAANSLLRESCRNQTTRLGKQLFFPELQLCTDNAAMIAAAGYYHYLHAGPGDLDVTAEPNLKL